MTRTTVRRTVLSWLATITDRHVIRGYNIVLGVIGALTGVIMLGLPHRFEGHTALAFLADNLNLWGITFLVAGVILSTTAVVAPDRSGVPCAALGATFTVYAVLATLVAVAGAATGIGALWALGYAFLCLLGVVGSYVPTFQRWLRDQR